MMNIRIFSKNEMSSSLLIFIFFFYHSKLQSWTIGNVVTEWHSRIIAKISLHLGGQFGNADSRVQELAPELDWNLRT
jgi:hypothetical protein